MADLPVISAVCELYKLFHLYLKSFPRMERYSLGNKIENLILEILELLTLAVYLPKYKKFECLQKASQKIDFLKRLIRLSFELKLLNSKKYLLLAEKILEIGRMAGGWQKAS